MVEKDEIKNSIRGEVINDEVVDIGEGVSLIKRPLLPEEGVEVIPTNPLAGLDQQEKDQIRADEKRVRAALREVRDRLIDAPESFPLPYTARTRREGINLHRETAVSIEVEERLADDPLYQQLVVESDSLRNEGQWPYFNQLAFFLEHDDENMLEKRTVEAEERKRYYTDKLRPKLTDFLRRILMRRQVDIYKDEYERELYVATKELEMYRKMQQDRRDPNIHQKIRTCLEKYKKIEDKMKIIRQEVEEQVRLDLGVPNKYPKT